jgi:predicted phage terminase large subunit-like protein
VSEGGRAKAAETLLRRRRIRSSMIEWSRFCDVEPALHHQLICNELDALSRGEFDRLAIMAPPGSAKTTYASHLFPPLYLARNPTHLVLSGSHTQDFASRKIGRKVRNLIERHNATLGLEIDTGSRSMDDWALTTGGGYRAVGVGVAVAGERADLGVVEDPFARWEDAQREGVQEDAWEWYTGDFVPRLKPNAKRVIIMTRFNEFDLLGRVLERDAALGFKWRTIRLPMIAEDDDPIGRNPGDRLWPEWFTEDMVTEARADPQKWIALYQQRPSVETGDYFKAEWLRSYTKRPDLGTLRIYGASDFAVSQGKGDYTVHVVVGMDPDGQLWLLDLWRQRSASDLWVESFCDLVLQWKPMGWAFETGQINSGVGPFLKRRMRERKAYVAIENFPTRGDKSIRAQSIRGRIALDGLNVPTMAHWYAELRAEMMAFPAGKHDDQVDALGLVGQLLNRMLTGSDRKQKQKAPPRDKYAKAWAALENADANWRTI